MYCGLADVYWDAGRYAEAQSAAYRALDLLRSSGQNSQIGAATFILGKIAMVQHRDAEAEQLIRSALDLWRTSLGQDHLTYISGLPVLAVLLSRKDRRAAERMFDESLRLAETRFGREHVFTGYTLLAYAGHLESVGRRTEGRHMRNRAKAIVVRHARENRLGGTIDITRLAKEARR